MQKSCIRPPIWGPGLKWVLSEPGMLKSAGRQGIWDAEAFPMGVKFRMAEIMGKLWKIAKEEG